MTVATGCGSTAVSTVGQVNLAKWLDAAGNSGLVFSGITGIYALREIGHLHRDHEERDGNRGGYADNDGIGIEKLLVTTHGTAPGMLLCDIRAGPGGGGRLYYKVRTNAVTVYISMEIPAAVIAMGSCVTT